MSSKEKKEETVLQNNDKNEEKEETNTKDATVSSSIKVNSNSTAKPTVQNDEASSSSKENKTSKEGVLENKQQHDKIKRVKITVNRATNVKGDLFSKAESYVLLSLNKQKFKSKIIKSSNPVWEETFEFLISDEKKDTIHLVLKEDDILVDDTLLKIALPVSEWEGSEPLIEKVYPFGKKSQLFLTFDISNLVADQPQVSNDSNQIDEEQTKENEQESEPKDDSEKEEPKKTASEQQTNTEKNSEESNKIMDTKEEQSNTEQLKENESKEEEQSKNKETNESKEAIPSIVLETTITVPSEEKGKEQSKEQEKGKEQSKEQETPDVVVETTVSVAPNDKLKHNGSSKQLIQSTSNDLREKLSFDSKSRIKTVSSYQHLTSKDGKPLRRFNSIIDMSVRNVVESPKVNSPQNLTIPEYFQDRTSLRAKLKEWSESMTGAIERDIRETHLPFLVRVVRWKDPVLVNYAHKIIGKVAVMQARAFRHSSRTIQPEVVSALQTMSHSQNVEHQLWLFKVIAEVTALDDDLHQNSQCFVDNGIAKSLYTMLTLSYVYTPKIYEMYRVIGYLSKVDYTTIYKSNLLQVVIKAALYYVNLKQDGIKVVPDYASRSLLTILEHRMNDDNLLRLCLITGAFRPIFEFIVNSYKPSYDGCARLLNYIISKRDDARYASFFVNQLPLSLFLKIIKMNDYVDHSKLLSSTLLMIGTMGELSESYRLALIKHQSVHFLMEQLPSPDAIDSLTILSHYSDIQELIFSKPSWIRLMSDSILDTHVSDYQRLQYLHILANIAVSMPISTLLLTTPEETTYFDAIVSQIRTIPDFEIPLAVLFIHCSMTTNLLAFHAFQKSPNTRSWLLHHDTLKDTFAFIPKALYDKLVVIHDHISDLPTSPSTPIDASPTTTITTQASSSTEAKEPLASSAFPFHICALNSCNKVGKFTLCACQRAYYCSADCQKAHWKTHKFNCVDSDKFLKEQQERLKNKTANSKKKGDDQVGLKGSIVLHVVAGEDIVDGDVLFSSEIYVRGTLNGRSLFRTKAISTSNGCPSWNEQFTIPIEDSIADDIQLDVYDKDVLSKDDRLGSTMLSLDTIENPTKLTLLRKGKPSGVLVVRIDSQLQ